MCGRRTGTPWLGLRVERFTDPRATGFKVLGSEVFSGLPEACVSREKSWLPSMPWSCCRAPALSTALCPALRAGRQDRRLLQQLSRDDELKAVGAGADRFKSFLRIASNFLEVEGGVEGTQSFPGFSAWEIG